eukprot:ANDGO_03906.mRNA.1 hypothetical protein EMIHUDRAFT_212350
MACASWEDVRIKYTPHANHHLDLIEKYAEEVNEWHPLSEERGISVSKRKVDGWPVHCVRGSLTIQAPLQHVYDIVTHADTRSVWDENCVEGKTVHSFSGVDVRVDYIATRQVAVVSSRDMAFCFAWRKHENGHPASGRRRYVTTSWSVEHGDTLFDPVLSLRSGRVRGHVYLGGLMMEETDDGHTAVSMVACADPKGWLPHAVVNVAAAKGVMCLDSIRTYAMQTLNKKKHTSS